MTTQEKQIQKLDRQLFKQIRSVLTGHKAKNQRQKRRDARRAR